MSHRAISEGWLSYALKPLNDLSTNDMMTELKRYKGSCHCGAIQFEVKITPEEHTVEDCNCSICRKKGFLHLIVPLDRFTLLTGVDSLTTYSFNTHTAKHTFCKICGMHPFYTPRSHPNKIDVNVRCLDGDVLSNFQIIQFDGQNWEANITELQKRNPL